MSSDSGTPARASVHVLLADDHPTVLAAVRSRLEQAGFGSIATALDSEEALAAAAERRPAVAVVDIHIPSCSGAELVRRLREAVPRLRVLVYTAEADAHTTTELLEAGAAGLLLKGAPLSELILALDAVLAGRPYVDPAVGAAAPPHPRLTERERQVLALVAEGLAHDEIGRRLGIGAETVRTHSRKAADRLGARSRTQAVATAIRLRLI